MIKSPTLVVCSWTDVEPIELSKIAVNCEILLESSKGWLPLDPPQRKVVVKMKDRSILFCMSSC